MSDIDISTPITPQRHSHAEARRRPLPADLKNSPKYPWSLIQLDYCAGVIPINGICHKYSPLSKSRLLTIAQREGWVRYVLTADDIYGSKVFGLHPHAPGMLQLSNDDVRKTAVVQAMQVIDCHRRDIARARGMFETLMSRMLMALNGTPDVMRDPDTGDPVLDADDNQVLLPGVSGRETPSDALNKLTSSLVRIVGLERQAYGLEVLGVVDPAGGDASNADQVKSDLAALESRLDDIAARKAEPVAQAAPSTKD